MLPEADGSVASLAMVAEREQKYVQACFVNLPSDMATRHGRAFAVRECYHKIITHNCTRAALRGSCIR